MGDGQIADATLLNSIIGEGTRLRGEFEIDGLLRIDGDFCGTIRTTGKILVGLNGRAACNIYADTVVVGGVVRGNIFCTDRVVVLSTGMVLGNVTSPRLVVEEGVVFHGVCRVGVSKTRNKTGGLESEGRVMEAGRRAASGETAQTHAAPAAYR
jgi:cytoskeletal protein CcmA (bactofilin family)